MIGVSRWAPSPPIPARDRMWCATRSTRLFTGMTRPDPDALRATLRQLAAIAPGHRIFTRPTPDHRRWWRVAPEDLPDLCDRMVTTSSASARDGEGGGSGEAIVAGIHNDPADAPAFRFTVGKDFLAVRSEHAVTDGATLTSWFSALWSCALTGRSPRALVISNPSLPLVRGLANVIRQDPRRPAAMLTGSRSGPPRPVPEPGRERPWTPSPATIAATSGPEALAEARAWRSRRAPDISVAAVLFAAARQALENEGISPARRGMSVVVDNRRYLPTGTQLEGNFSAGIYLEPADPTSPADVYVEMRGAIDSGRPMASLVMGAARETLRPSPARRLTTTAAPRPLLTLTHLGRLRAFEEIPLDGPTGSGPRFLSLTTPWLAEDLTLFLSELYGALHVSAAFNAGVLAEAPLRRAVDALVANPVELLGKGPRAVV